MPGDILLDNNWDLLTKDGDFVIGESTIQHQELLILSSKGDFKENPTTCIGAPEWLKDEEVSGLLAETKKEFERDGMTVNLLEFTSDEKFNVDAHY